MEQIGVGNRIKILYRNPSDWFRETVTINLSGNYNGMFRKERAELVSGIAYPEIMELGNAEQLGLFTKMMGNEHFFESFKRKGEIRIVCRGLRSGTPFLARANSLDEVVAGSEIFGQEDMTYLLFGSMLNYITFLDKLNNKLKKK